MINTVVVLGNLTKDPEQRKTSNDKVVTSFSIAVNGYNEHVNYFNIQAWGKTAEFVAKYLKKGSQVVVDGRLAQQVWEKDGAKHYDVVIVADNVQSTAANKPSDNNKGTQTQVLEQALPTDTEVDDSSPDMIDNIPF